MTRAEAERLARHLADVDAEGRVQDLAARDQLAVFLGGETDGVSAGDVANAQADHALTQSGRPMTHAEAERREIERRLQVLRAVPDREPTAVEQSEETALLAMLGGDETEIALAIAGLEAVDIDEEQRAERERLHATLRDGALDSDADPDDDEPLPPGGRSAATLREQLQRDLGQLAPQLRQTLEDSLRASTPGGRLRAYLESGPKARADVDSLCQHEGCHSVVGTLNGERVDSIRLYVSDDAAQAETAFATGVKVSAATLAAGAAGARLTGHANRSADSLSSGDRRYLALLGVREERFEWCIQGATKHLRAHWPAVKRIAAELLETSFVSGDRVREIIAEEGPRS